MNSEFLAVYGTLKREYNTQRELGIDKMLDYEGPCTIPGKEIEGNQFVCVVEVKVEEGVKERIEVVTGELYKIKKSKIKELLAITDEYEEYDPEIDCLFTRKKTMLIDPHLGAWVYYYNEKEKGVRVARLLAYREKDTQEIKEVELLYPEETGEVESEPKNKEDFLDPIEKWNTLIELDLE